MIKLIDGFCLSWMVLAPCLFLLLDPLEIRRSLFRYGERHCLGLSWEDVVVSVNQLDLHFVLAGRQPGYVDCVVVACIRPPPGQVVDSDMQMPNTEMP